MVLLLFTRFEIIVHQRVRDGIRFGSVTLRDHPPILAISLEVKYGCSDVSSQRKGTGQDSRLDRPGRYLGTTGR